MKFEITERSAQLHTMTYRGVPFDPHYITYYDVVRCHDRKVIKAFTDLVEALHYKSELEKLLG